MAMRTLTRMYDNHQDAVEIVRSLEAAGFNRDDISIVSHDSNGHGRTEESGSGAASGAGGGAAAGTIIGGGLGTLAGIGALAIPGVGPVVAAGWLVALITGAGAGAAVGAGAGGIIGALTGAGVSEEDAHVYAEGVRRGGSLINVRTEDARAPEAEAILESRSPVEPGMRRAEYNKAGWERFDDAQGSLARPASGQYAENRNTL